MKPGKTALLLLVPLVVLAGLAVATGDLPYRAYVVHTGSMAPTISPRSEVIVRLDRYRIGQVITFIVDGQVVTHRLVSISESGLITTKGDANRTDDPWHVPRTDIIGGVVFAPRQVGYWLVYLRSPMGWASVLLGLVVCWLVWGMAGEGTRGQQHRMRSATGRRRVSPPSDQAVADQAR